jgi:hypothetical protein
MHLFLIDLSEQLSSTHPPHRRYLALTAKVRAAFLKPNAYADDVVGDKGEVVARIIDKRHEKVVLE